jgi:hypothetical protein
MELFFFFKEWFFFFLFLFPFLISLCLDAIITFGFNHHRDHSCSGPRIGRILPKTSPSSPSSSPW